MKSIATAVAAAMLIAGGYAANSQMGSHMAHHPKMAKGNSTAAMCKQMMGERHQAMMHMNEMDTKLNSMVQTMDLATGDDKIAAMSDLLKTLVSQRTQMRSMMESMDSKMMGHMMMHMKSGGMMQCPMMMDMMKGGMMKGGMMKGGMMKGGMMGGNGMGG